VPAHRNKFCVGAEDDRAAPEDAALPAAPHKAAAIFPLNPFSRQCETIFIAAE
jgi:hypothetical protein